MTYGIFVEFDASHHAVVDLLVLGAILVLPLASCTVLSRDSLVQNSEVAKL